MPEVMVTSPVPGKGLGCPSCLSQGLSSPSLPAHHCPPPLCPTNLTRRRGGHGSHPVPQLWGDKSPVELPAFLSDHTCAISYPQPWKRPEELVPQTQCSATSNLSPTFLPQSPASSAPNTYHSWGQISRLECWCPQPGHEALRAPVGTGEWGQRVAPLSHCLLANVHSQQRGVSAPARSHCLREENIGTHG